MTWPSPRHLPPLKKRAVDAAEPFAHFTVADKELRTRLSARGRPAGDVPRANKAESIDQRTPEHAHEYWQRLRCARFVAENQRLLHPDGWSWSRRSRAMTL